MPEGRTPGASTGSPVVGDWRVARVGHALVISPDGSWSHSARRGEHVASGDDASELASHLTN